MKPENKATDTAVPSVDELTGELNREKYHSRYKKLLRNFHLYAGDRGRDQCAGGYTAAAGFADIRHLHESNLQEGISWCR